MYKFTLVFVILIRQVFSQEFKLQAIATNVDASFRGLSVVDDKIIWVSGSSGWVGKSTNGGNNWEFKQVTGFEKCDFRTLYAFGSDAAIIAVAGSPASILYTGNGGESWKEVYKNTDSEAFFDGIDFWNEKEGVIYGDPIKGRLLILKTNDGGFTWHELEENKQPVLAEGEASFAASGTTIRCTNSAKVAIATGGKVSRLLVSNDMGENWNSINTPIIQGLSSRGIFSLACHPKNNTIIVGGDYKIDSLTADHVFYSKDNGKSWLKPSVPTRGYRECVEYINEKTAVAVGPKGMDISADGGMNWRVLSDETGFHVMRKARKGNLIIMAGAKGKLSLLLKN